MQSLSSSNCKDRISWKKELSNFVKYNSTNSSEKSSAKQNPSQVACAINEIVERYDKISKLLV